MDGTLFGHYRLVELLGRGGMGEVWRAYDTVTDRVVAIKVLPAHLSEDSEFQQRFRREAHAAARLNDPHVIPIHNYGEIDDRLYVDMRLIEGRDLQAVLDAGPLSPARAVHIIEQVAKALNAAHRIGLVHRDVKPSNILLDADDFAYLIDFGIARRTDETKLTNTNATIGTWTYMSPERMRPGEVDARSDIYALACVLYECLTGSPPFPGDTFESQAMAHLMDPPPRPSVTSPEVPWKVDEVIATGMAKDPDHRYATTVELADAARDAITDPIARPAPTPTRPHAEPPPNPFSPPAGPTDRHPPPPRSPWAPADTRDHGKSPAATVADSGSTPRPFAPFPTPQPKRRTGLIAAIVATVVVAAAGTIGVTGYLLLGDRHPTQPPAAAPAPSSSPAPSTPAAPPPPPSAPNTLDGLLLSVEQINTDMGVTGMTSAGTMTVMPDFSSRVADKACLPLAYGAQANVYAGTGVSALSIEVIQKPAQNAVNQAVVLFNSPQYASSFFTASAQNWQACANRPFTITMSGFSQQHAVGSVSDTNGILSATVTAAGTNSSCQRALTVVNAVAIDITTCVGPPDAAVNIAQQIAAKVH